METFKMFVPEKKLLLTLHTLGSAVFHEMETNQHARLLLESVKILIESLWNETKILEGLSQFSEITQKYTDDSGTTAFHEVINYIKSMQNTEAIIELDRNSFGIELMSIFYIANQVQMSENILIYISHIMRDYFSIEELEEFDQKVVDIMSSRYNKNLKQKFNHNLN